MYKQGKFYTLTATGFLYSLIIVDLYRKFEGANVDSLRNIVYISSFALLLIDMYKSKHLKTMFSIAVVTLMIFGLSILLNPGYSEVYSSSIMLFISRLWPAFYIGRYTEDWDTLSKSVLFFSPIALAYAISLIIIPEISDGDAYATIASNLAFVSLISFFSCIYYKKYIWLPIVIICLIPVFFYGTRAFFLGVFLSLFLAYLINLKKISRAKRSLLFTGLVVLGLILLVFNEVIFNQLYEWFPESRTLKMMTGGDFLDDSNRGSFYGQIFQYLENNPFGMLGLIGDRIYLSSSYASTAEILSMFSHNCCLELCMNFGLFMGIALNMYFLNKLYMSLKKCFSTHKTINYIYVLIFGAGFINMMVSASYMGSYIPWLLFGLAFSICSFRTKNNLSHV